MKNISYQPITSCPIVETKTLQTDKRTQEEIQNFTYIFSNVHFKLFCV